jgi:hypothetical protein
MKSFLLALVAVAVTSFGFASVSSAGLVIHTSEFGVGKFHRADNKAHAYGTDNAWSPYILPDQAATNQPLIQKNADGSFTIFFSTLDEMLASVVKISREQGQKVSVLNVHGHGLPGAMWFPKDANALNSWGCSDWKDAANGSDSANYDQYYSPVSVSEIEQIRDMSNNPNVRMSCTTGLNEWQAAVAKLPDFKAALANDAQLHFLSCVVGLGTMGENFTKGMAALLLPNGSGHIETSMNFGLGDWSMPSGMGFWDYVSQAQVDHDNGIYPVDHKDAEIAQKGTIRVASFSGAQWGTSLLGNRDFMALSYENLNGVVLSPVLNARVSVPAIYGPLPSRIRVPGTNAYVHVEQQ